MDSFANTARGAPVAVRLAATICDAARRDEKDETVLHAVERLVLDTLGCALGAAGAAPVAAARAWARAIRGEPAAHLLGTRETSSVVGAALANCTMARHLDMNDCDWSQDPAHPSDNIAACLALAEGCRADVPSFLKSVLVAYEVQMRSTELSKVSFFKTTGWDHTTFVTLATAAAASVLLGLDRLRMAHALAIAGSYPTVGQLRVGQISMMKAVSAGLAASRGIEAAYLASHGITGPLEIFEGKRGMASIMLGECDWDVLTAPVDRWRLPRTCIKQYPAAYIIHSAIDATLALRREHALSPDRISAVSIAGFGWLIEDMVHGMGGKSRYDIDARETADHSLPYCVAVSLVDGEYTLTQLAESRWSAPELKSMLSKVKCVHDPALDGGFPANRPARIRVQTVDGAIYEKQVPFPKGDPRDPLTDAQLAHKFRQLSGAVLSPSGQARAIEVALDLRRHSVAALVQACSPEPTA
ncbi:MAG: MmgE/PrpD family protein [Burkholderiales bacterium]|nr:MmgE/PrpD family protein [Burkholderiales bacterium]